MLEEATIAGPCVEPPEVWGLEPKEMGSWFRLLPKEATAAAAAVVAAAGPGAGPCAGACPSTSLSLAVLLGVAVR